MLLIAVGRGGELHLIVVVVVVTIVGGADTASNCLISEWLWQETATDGILLKNS